MLGASGEVVADEVGKSPPQNVLAGTVADF